MKEIITYEELEEITSKAWLTVKEIMKITCVSKKEAYRLKKLIKEDLEKKAIIFLMDYYLHKKS